jgi:hypothetical protein
MKGEVTEAEYDPDTNRLEYTITFDNGDTAELMFRAETSLNVALSEDAMRELAGELPGTSVRDDVQDVKDMLRGSVEQTNAGLELSGWEIE